MQKGITLSVGRCLFVFIDKNLNSAVMYPFTYQNKYTLNSPSQSWPKAVFTLFYEFPYQKQQSLPSAKPELSKSRDYLIFPLTRE